MTDKIRAFLIDDDEPTNFLNKHLLKKTERIEEVKVFQLAKQAMDQLYKYAREGEEFPDLIFLDINMPGLDGWAFLNEYEKLMLLHEQRAVLIMLSTSVNPYDNEKAQSSEVISEFMMKPLDEKKLDSVLNKYFNN